MSRFRILVAAVLVLGGNSIGRADDLDRILARDKIAAGKLLSDASAALKDSVALEKTSPAAAAILLEKTIAEMKDASVLLPEDRAVWLSKLQARLNAVKDAVRVSQIAAEEKARREATEAFIRSKDFEPKTGGSGVSGTAKKYIGTVADQVAAADRLRKSRDLGAASVFRDIEVSATPIDGVVEYPKHWAAITEKRKTKLHPKEVALLQTLNSTMTADFEDRKFREVIDYIQKKTGLSIFLDRGSLMDAGVEYDDPVTFQYPKVSVRTVLKKILGDRNLTYVIKEGAIQVVTPMKAREMMVVRSYPVMDLVAGDPRFGPFAERFMAAKNAQGLIQNIQMAVEPSIWDVNGGTATITFHQPSMSLIVRAPAEMHYMLGSGGLFR